MAKIKVSLFNNDIPDISSMIIDEFAIIRLKNPDKIINFEDYVRDTYHVNIKHGKIIFETMAEFKNFYDLQNERAKHYLANIEGDKGLADFKDKNL